MPRRPQWGSLMERSPRWLYNALRLDSPEVPNALSPNEIVGVVDTLQGGHGVTPSENNYAWAQSNTDPAVTKTVITGDPDQQHLLFAAGAVNSLAVDMFIVMYHTRPGALVQVPYQAPTVAAGFTRGLGDWTGGRPIWFPPGYGLQVLFSAGGGGVASTFTVRFDWMTFPAGCKPY